MDKWVFIIVLLVRCLSDGFSQGRTIGAGSNYRGVRVLASDSYAYYSDSLYVAAPIHTIDGHGMDGRLAEAARLLSQASLGYDLKMIHQVADMGIEAWIEDQFEKESPDFIQLTREAYDAEVAYMLGVGGVDSSELPDDIYFYHFLYAWWQYQAFNAHDVLRQRVAEALSEIFVVSYFNDRLSSRGLGLAYYYNLLLKNAFGNFYDLLRDITYSPAMGMYLSHFQNPRTIPEENQHPDENYAREIMQLFTIGLYELNPDGTRKKDAQGRDIPTYDNDDISELAKVFTGLGASAIIDNPYVDTPSWDIWWGWVDFTQPMRMYEDWHEPGEKRLFGGKVVIPAGQTGNEDIAMALRALVDHPNVGPFIARRLIQRLVKSNPTPEYIRDVAAVFDDNGHGVRGDMKAVIRAILLHPEARECQWIEHPSAGKLREPLLRYVHVVRALPKDHPYDLYWNVGYTYGTEVGQNMFGAPSVFNFYKPDFVPNGVLQERGLFGPEYEIHHTQSSIEWINRVFIWTHWESLMWDWTPIEASTTADFYKLYGLARMGEPFINYCDLVFARGMMSDQTRQLIRDAFRTLQTTTSYKEDRVRLALFLTLISPDFTVLK